MKMVALLTAGLLLIAGAMLFGESVAARSQQPIPAPKVPDKLRPPQGRIVLLKMEAEGVQIYVSKEVEKGKFAWSFKAPLADLFVGGKKAGYHYAGPSWEATDGSKLVRDPAEEVVSAPAPKPHADIPWLRIKVRPEGKGEGVFGKVSHVLRLQTAGGLPPGHTPSRAGTEVGVRYKAVYYFYGPSR